MLLLKKGELVKKPPMATTLVRCSFYLIELSYLSGEIHEFIKYISYTAYRLIHFSN